MNNWSDIRNDFPVTSRIAYLNTAAAGPLARSTQEAAIKYYNQMMADGDQHWDDWLNLREQVRQQVARFINAEPEEIGLTTNTSSGMNVIVEALRGRGEVISSDLEFPVSTLPWMHRRIPVHFVKHINGEVRTEAILNARSAKTGVLSFSHVQFSNGCRLDPEELGNNKGDHLLVINASQSAGAFQIDVKRMKIDALCATGHKWLLSGYGTGFVYLNQRLLAETKPRAIGWLSVHEPYAMRNDEIHLRHDTAARAELGCPHFPGIFALGASLEMLEQIGDKNIEQRVLEINRHLTKRLQEEAWPVLSPLDEERFRSGETLVQVEQPASVVAHLARVGVIVTEKPNGIRVATNFFNNEDDIERLVEGLRARRVG